MPVRQSCNLKKAILFFVEVAVLEIKSIACKAQRVVI